MPLEFVGDTGVYLPTRDAIKFTAISSGRPIDCYVGRSAFAFFGCTTDTSSTELVELFRQNRDLIELAAMIKHRRRTAPAPSIDIATEDIGRAA
jgi:hypothetical protein